jgi:hydroxyacylglutathione hydrolase
MEDGDRLYLGEVLLEVVHVPGHRPEQINLLITDESRGDEPWCMLTADFLLVGDMARPDLAQGGEEGAETLFDTALPRLHALPDFVEVYPGHVAGST